MFGIDLLTAGSALILASGNQIKCEIPQKPTINVELDSHPVKYKTHLSMAAIQSVDTDTIDPYGTHGRAGTSVMQGYMEAGIEMNASVSLSQKTWPMHRKGCVWYDEITITMTIDPTIVIAREVYRDKCMRHAVIEHEVKHVNVDRRVVNEYSKIIANNLYQALRKQGLITELIPQRHMKRMGERMQENVFAIIRKEYKKMDATRMKKQQAVDSLDEYERVAAMCPNFKIPQSAVQASKRDKRRNAYKERVVIYNND